jgi:hypothetical protein
MPGVATEVFMEQPLGRRNADMSSDESFFGPDVNEYRPERWFEGENTRLDHAAFGIGGYTALIPGSSLPLTLYPW